MPRTSKSAFTLIELLITLGIVAVLSTVVVVTLNPAELLKQARDSTRISDLNTINTSLGTFAADVASAYVGSSTTVYVSIPDSSPTCSNLGLPSLPSGWVYSCSNTENYRKINGTGWVPANLEQISFGNPLVQLPIDPKNSTSTGLYYTFVTTGSWWELTAILESEKYGPRMVVDGGASPNAFEHGTDLTLTPIEALDRAVPASVNAPMLVSISPTSTTAGDPEFILTVIGENFTSSSVVRWAGVDKSTTFVSITELTATIPSADISATGTIAVTVYDPLNGNSGSSNFAISEPPGFLAGTWSTEPTAGLTQGNGASMVEVDGKYYVITGNGVNFQRYDPIAQTWTTLAVVPYTSVGSGASIVKYDNNTLYAIRGATANNFYKYVISTNTWTNMALPPSASGAGGSLVYPGTGDYLYLLRGGNYTSFWRYSVSLNAWSANDPAQDNGASIAEANGKYYVIIGNGTDFQKYDPSTQAWSTLATIPFNSGSGASIVKYDNNTLYAIRGAAINNFYKYVISTNTWTNMTLPPAAASHGGSLAYPGTGDYIYLLRGASSNSFWRYSVSNNNWVSNDPSQNDGASITEANGKYYVITGNGVDFKEYNPATRMWTTLAVVPYTSVGSGASIVKYDNNTLYAIRGATANNFYKYVISTNTWTNMALPPSASGAGGSLVYPGTGDYLYLLRGGNYTSFWRYSVSLNAWSLNDPAQDYGASIVEVNGKYYVVTGNGVDFKEYNPATRMWTTLAVILWSSVGSGTALTKFDNDTIYAVRGGTANHYKYTISTNTWTNLPVSPSAHGSGGSLAYPGTGDYLYSLRGANTTTFWRTLVTDNSWEVITPAPSTVYSGGALVAVGTDTLYALRGNDTTTFWKYTISTGIWEAKASTPGTIREGGSLTTDGTNIFALRGNGTPSLYKYTIGTDTWSTLANAPGNIGAAGPNSRGGLAYSSVTGKIHAISGGSASFEYNPATDSWIWPTPATAPAAVYSGGALAVLDTDTLYAFRGGNTTTFWEYKISTGFWSAKAPAPATIQSGGSLTSDGINVYGFRGNGTPTFYKYTVGSDSWSTVLDAPWNIGEAGITAKGGLAYSSTTGKIFAISGNAEAFEYNLETDLWTWPSLAHTPATVGAGGALAVLDTDTLYAFRGGNTTTFWQYKISTGLWSAKAPAPATIQSGGSLTSDGINVYGFRGNGTPTFYKYTVGTDTWSTLADTPRNIGEAAATAKGGLAYSSTTGKIYAISGNAEAFEYNLTTDTWTWPSTSYAPATVGAGGALVALNSDTLYALRGASTTVFWQYKISTGFWSVKAPTPEAIQNGGSLTTDGTNIFALRGAGTPTFYKYTVGTDSWSTLSDAPGNIGAANTTAAKGGISYSSVLNAIYAISGNSGAIYKNSE